MRLPTSTLRPPGLLALLLAAVLSGCSTPPPTPTPAATTVDPAAGASTAAAASTSPFASAQPPAPARPLDAAAALRALLDEDLADNYRRNPLNATTRGVEGYNDKLPDVSLAQRERERAYERGMLERLQALDTTRLNPNDRLSHALLLNKMRNTVEAQQFAEADALVLGTLGGVQNLLPRAAQLTPFRTAGDYRDFIRRIEAAPLYAEQTAERARAGLRSGWMRPAAVLDRVVGAIDAHLVERAEDSVLFGPFQRFPAGVPEPEREALAESARRAIEDRYQPALRRFRTFIETELRPAAPAEAGLSSLPGGGAYYEFLIRSNIVGDSSARDIHAIGLQQVARVRTEIGRIARQTGRGGNVDGFMNELRTDRRYFFGSAQELLAAYRAMAARVDPQLPRLFHAVPRMPYAVRGMTQAESASSTAANYTPGSLRLGTHGFFTINALGFAAEPTWKKESLFVHETVPGHHMQVARAAEVQGLHPWRQSANWNVAYGEGWALYAEKLGFDLGLYTDPYQHYGHLQAELWRAARLVVDTGIHAFGWSRARAVDYMQSQAGLTAESASSEVDRYFSNPSQALGYMMGQRKMIELRSRAQRSLGGRFDVRDFHAVVIDRGAMPLAVLEAEVDAWIAAGGGRPARL